MATFGQTQTLKDAITVLATLDAWRAEIATLHTELAADLSPDDGDLNLVWEDDAWQRLATLVDNVLRILSALKDGT